MAAKYRVVHFVPDPFNGARIPVAAIVASGRGVSLAPAGHLPEATCLGTPALYAAMQMVLESLLLVDDLNMLPVSTGPHAVLDVERQIPGDVADPVAWVVDHILPRPADRTGRVVQSHHRHTQGYRFFETWNVSQYVHQRFQPEQYWIGPQASMPRKLGSISHWVGAPKVGVMLMEPLIPTRPSFDRDLIEVYQRFASYRAFLGRGDALQDTTKSTQLCVYVLPGGRDVERSSALGAFADVEAIAVDIESTTARASFIERITSLGQAAEPQPDLSERATN